MKDLKEILFENMYCAQKLAHRKELKTITSYSYMEEATTLYGIIIESGLAEEYAKYFVSKERERYRSMGIPLIHNDSDYIRVTGHRGTWHVIDSCVIRFEEFFLLEHDIYGKDVANVVVNQYGELIEEDVWNGFDDCVLETIDAYFSKREES